MEIILHAGAHRTASTSFQRYMREQAPRLAGQGIGFWGPGRTRDGLLQDILQRPATPQAAARAAGRMRLNLRASEKRGTAMLIVSDENMIGTPRACLRAGRLYPEIGERMARLHQAMQGVARVALQIRAPDSWWASALAFLVPRGAVLPDDATLEALSHAPRSWRHVITDLACACPGADIRVTLFEHFADHPDRLLAQMAGVLHPPGAAPGAYWINRSPDLDALRSCLTDRQSPSESLPQGQGRWMPFSPLQAARLREAYADDLFWLRAGAEGLATLTEEDVPAGPAYKLAATLDRRGPKDDRTARRLAQARRSRTAWPSA